MHDSVTGIQPSAPPENGTNKPAEQNIDKNASDEYEDTSPQLNSRMSDALDDSAYLEQAIRMLNETDGKIEKQFCQIFPTPLPFSFEKNVSEMHKYLEKIYLPPEYKLSHRNRVEDELKPETAFDQRIKTALFGLAALILLGLACFALVWIGICLGLRMAQENSNGMTHISNASTERENEELRNSLDAEIKQRRETESELKLIQRYWDELSHDKASTQRENEELRNSLATEIKQRRETESELKLAQGALKELRRDNVKTENGPTRPGDVDWRSFTLIVLALLGLNWFVAVCLGRTCTCLYLLSLCLLGVVWLYSTIMWLYSTFIVVGLFGFACYCIRAGEQAELASTENRYVTWADLFLFSLCLLGVAWLSTSWLYSTLIVVSLVVLASACFRIGVQAEALAKLKATLNRKAHSASVWYLNWTN